MDQRKKGRVVRRTRREGGKRRKKGREKESECEWPRRGVRQPIFLCPNALPFSACLRFFFILLPFLSSPSTICPNKLWQYRLLYTHCRKMKNSHIFIRSVNKFSTKFSLDPSAKEDTKKSQNCRLFYLQFSCTELLCFTLLTNVRENVSLARKGGKDEKGSLTRRCKGYMWVYGVRDDSEEREEEISSMGTSIREFPGLRLQP